MSLRCASCCALNPAISARNEASCDSTSSFEPVSIDLVMDVGLADRWTVSDRVLAGLPRATCGN